MKITCPLCNNKKVNFLKKVNQIDIFECKYCKVAIIPKNKKTNKIIYDFYQYNKLKLNYIKRFQPIINKIKSIKKSGTVLDIGCGFGLHSYLLHKEGYKVESIEPYQKTYYVEKSPVHKSTFQKFLKDNVKKYDIILLMDVIEHFKNPTNILKKIKPILKSNGLLVIQTPNYQSIMAKICKNWSWWMIEDHKLIFSKISLIKILKDNKFRILKNETYEDIGDFKKNLDGNFTNIKNNYIRKLLKILFIIPFFTLYIPFKKIVWSLGFGGLILNISKNHKL